jgi:hypothetical protein
VPVKVVAVGGQEDWSFAAFADGQVDRPGRPRGQWDRHDFAALAGDDQCPVAAFDAHRFDAGAGGFGDSQPVQGKQGDQRVLHRRAEPGGHQQCTKFVAVQAHRVGLVINARTADMGGGRVIEEFFFDGIAVEPGDGGQPPGDGGPGSATRFQVADETFDVSAPGTEKADVVLMAPAGVLTQIQLIGLAGQAAVASQETS